MAYDILPEENLHFSDIRDCLNSAGGSVTNDMITAFQESAKVNKWAKYKPENIDKPFDITEDDRINNSYNITLPIVDAGNISNVGAFVNKSILPAFPKRLEDFRGYYKNAVPPFSVDIKDTYYTNATELNVVYIDIDADIVSSDKNLKLSDVFKRYYGNWYFGTLTYNKTRNIPLWKTEDLTVNNWYNGRQFTAMIDSNWSETDEIYIYAIVSQYPNTSGAIIPIEPNSMFYLNDEKAIGYKKIKLDEYNYLKGKVSIVDVQITFTYDGYDEVEYKDKYTIQKIMITIHNESQQIFPDTIFRLNLDDHSDGSIFEFSEKTIQINANGNTVVAYDEIKQISNADGINGINITLSNDRYGDVIMPQSWYDFNNREWITTSPYKN